jgi:hypothetical protein
MALAKITSFLAKANLILIPFPPAKAGGNSITKKNLESKNSRGYPKIPKHQFLQKTISLFEY